MVSSQGISDERQVFVLEEVEEGGGFEPWEAALFGFPSPVKVTHVRSAMADAVLTVLDCTAARAVV